jgi:hypothetical protein
MGNRSKEEAELEAMARLESGGAREEKVYVWPSSPFLLLPLAFITACAYLGRNKMPKLGKKKKDTTMPRSIMFEIRSNFKIKER